VYAGKLTTYATSTAKKLENSGPHHLCRPPTLPIKEDRHLSMETITYAHGVSEKMIFSIIHKILGLEKMGTQSPE
jgi:hypothetical protein